MLGESNLFHSVKHLGLKSKLLLSFLLVGLLSVVVTGWQSFVNARDALEKITFERLTSIRETKKRQIESYFTQTYSQIVTLAEDRMIIEATKQFARVMNASHRREGNRFDHNLRQSFHNETVNDRWVTEYKAVNAIYDPILQNYISRFRYDDLLLVDARSGYVVYSVAKKADFATTLVAGTLVQTNVARAFMHATSSERKGFVVFADFAPYIISDSLPAAFIAAPVFDGSTKLGVVICQISLRDINSLMTSNKNWKAEGLGETGETYIVGSDFTMRNDSRFFIQEPDRYFKQLISLNGDSATVKRIQSRSTSILLQEARTEATVDALRGNTDTKIVNDYRNVPVLSSYSPLNIQGVHWVIVAEMDASEAFYFVYALREKLILVALVIVLIGGVLGVLISQTISRPILSLAKTVDRFGKGDHSSRATVRSGDEIGALASGFNRMAENIEQQTSHLTNEIHERSQAEKRLRRSRERLRSLSGHLQSVREEERKGLAREIHDELGQALSTIKLNLSLLMGELNNGAPKMNERLSSISRIIDGTIKSVKRLITELRPGLLDDLGLTAAMQWQAEEFHQRTGISCHITFSPVEILLDADRSIAIFRIFQETLSNAMRHSGARNVTAKLSEYDDEIDLVVEDDGKGITEEQATNARSFGLLGIRERARYWGGSVEISGAPGKGTRVAVKMNVVQGKEQYD